jgi:AcrR family transcriptional regulator
MTQQDVRWLAASNDRVDARVARTRVAVLDAGARLLFTDGWDAVTHLRVAEASGVGRATVYRHWPTVEDLLTDVLVDCQVPLEPPTPTGDLRTDLIAAIAVFVDPLSTSQLPNILVTAMERASSDPRIQAMHESMTRISRHPVWTVAQTAIEQGELNPELTEEIVAAHTLGPILYQRLFDGQHITPTDIERTVDTFLTAFTNRDEWRRR